MLTPAEREHIDSIAWQATRGMVGQDAAVPHGDLHDAIAEGIENIVEAAYDRGVKASMIQLSLVPDGAKAVG